LFTTFNALEFQIDERIKVIKVVKVVKVFVVVVVVVVVVFTKPKGSPLHFMR